MTQPIALIGNPPDSAWAEIVAAAVAPLELGPVDQIPTSQLAEQGLPAGYRLALIDTVNLVEPEQLVAQLHLAQPKLLIIVFTASLTWRRGRDMFLAGAADYVRKTPELRKVRHIIASVLERTGAEPDRG